MTELSPDKEIAQPGPYDKAVLLSASTHIRLLRISPSSETAADDSAEGHFSAPIVGEFKTVSISEPPAYSALSYTWGGSNKTHQIRLGSDEQLGITESLDTAMRYVRKRDISETLWIDQICINQADLAEKNGQISLMGSIYGKAEQVLVWLGPSSDDSDRVMDILERVGQEARDIGFGELHRRADFEALRHVLSGEDPNDPLTTRWQALLKRNRPDYIRCVDAMSAWIRRPWFKRVWVLQEFCLGRDTVFICGTKRVDADLAMLGDHAFYLSIATDANITTAMQFKLKKLLRSPTAKFFSARARRRAHDEQRSHKTGDSLFELLKRLYVDQEMLATEERDRIFSVLGLATDDVGIRPDYTDPDYPRLLRRTARAILEHNGPAVLSFSQFPKSVEGLPSWVPDWRSNLAPSYYEVVPHAHQHVFQAAGSTELRLEITDDDAVLALEGFVVDTVEESAGPWYQDATPTSYIGSLLYLSSIKLLCLLSAAKAHPIYGSEARRKEAIWRVPIGDLYRPNGTLLRATSDVASTYQDFVFLREYFEQIKISMPPEEKDALRGEWTAKFTAAQPYITCMKTMDRKRPYMTAKGYVGMGPLATQPGDLVVVFLGSRIPHVLRPRSDSTFNFLGEAYCDGIMDGELAGKLPTQKFCLT